MKKIKRYLLMGLAAILIVGAMIVLLPNKNTGNIPVVNSGNNQQGENNNDNQPIGNYREMSGYDYIMEVMNTPQLWDESKRPPYNLSWEEEEALKQINNATAWNCIDETNAIFKRGYEGTLEINFSNFTAISKRYPDEEKFYNLFDYTNNVFKNIIDGDEMNHYMVDNEEEQYASGEIIYSDVYFIKETMLEYEKKFSKVGIPLLNQPAGTLESYKNVTVRIYEEQKIDDGLIHYVWEQDGFDWDWSDSDNVVWLKDYRDILEIEVPETELYEIHFPETGEIDHMALNSPLFMVCVDKNAPKNWIIENKPL